MANETMTLIQKITVGAAGASSIDFTNIPQTYTDLVIKCSLRTNRNSSDGDDLKVLVNGSTASVYSNRRLYGNGSGTGSDSLSGTNNSYIGMASTNSQTASTFGSTEFYFPNYTSSNNKSMSADGVAETNATTALATLGAWLWASSSAITQLTLYPYNGSSFAQYSTAYLYGVVKQGVTPAASSSPYATGGDSITFDGTNWIHTFYSTGTFTPSKALSNVDYLVVAGGGGGGRVGGGGGAGGLRCTVTATGGGGSLESKLNLAANTAYTVTVGAGGSGSTSRANKGSNGSNSVFSTITSTGGGGGGSYNNASGASGGSGGGSTWGQALGSGGSGTANQGYAGGTSPNTSGSADSNNSGGGGAGAVGANGGSTGGNGGAGVTTSISGSSVTYAGGGGGGGGELNNGASQTAAGSGGSGGGGAGSTGTSNATGGTANTGGGGGGSRDAGGGGGNGGAGGSGIVIVRYPA